MNWVFGVKSGDLEEARRWVEAATGLVGQYKDHMDEGGEHFVFDKGTVPTIKLLQNIDIITGRSFTSKKFEKWRLIVTFWINDRDSPHATALEAMPSRFTLLGEVEL